MIDRCVAVVVDDCRPWLVVVGGCWWLLVFNVVVGGWWWAWCLPVGTGGCWWSLVVDGGELWWLFNNFFRLLLLHTKRTMSNSHRV